MTTLFIIALSAILGYEVISRVPSILHTPLMSGSNFIHGVVLIGAMIALGEATGFWQVFFGFIAVVFGTVNAVGGYVLTERTLEMFKPSEKKEK